MRGRVQTARVARLATIDPDGRPHLVPIVFVLDGQRQPRTRLWRTGGASSATPACAQRQRYSSSAARPQGDDATARSRTTAAHARADLEAEILPSVATVDS